MSLRARWTRVALGCFAAVGGGASDKPFGSVDAWLQ